MRETNSGVVWTPQAQKRLMELMTGQENLTYQEAAVLMTAEFGVTFTKNSCIGRGRRLGIPQRKLTITQLKYRQCRWPLGEFEDRPPYMYCGLPTVSEGCSWCLEHFKKAHATSYNAKMTL